VLLQPTQLYESFSLFVLFFGLLWVYRRRKFDGEVALIYFIAYPIIRSIIEIYRGDEIRGFLIKNVLSTSQFISFLILAAAVVWFFKLAGRNREQLT
jgi:phosphatidylglycerol---prolipoprotein diacylglyceryl transferase